MISLRQNAARITKRLFETEAYLQILNRHMTGDVILITLSIYSIPFVLFQSSFRQ